MKNFIKVMKALSDPHRAKIIELLQLRASLCVCEIRAMLKLSQPTVSNHLKVLEEVGLVVSEKEKLWVNYRLHSAGGSLYSAAMLAQLENWLDETPEVKEIHRLLP